MPNHMFAEKMNLKICVAKLYDAFADVPKPQHIDACPCCIEDKHLCTLLSKALRELSPDDLSSYSSSAFLTAGDVPDYLYFLPRIMEISVTDESWWPDPEVTGRAIYETSPENWPTQRRIAFEELLCSLFETFLTRQDSGSQIDSWMCAVSRMTLDITPYLKLIQTSPSHVVQFYEENSNSIVRKNTLSNSFWDEQNTGYLAILDWFHSEEVKSIISSWYAQQNSEQGGAANPLQPSASGDC